tara:strand:+ start:1599 stop:2162 length:564 start_codon:yes stop_codon:yes gene_type:complete
LVATAIVVLTGCVDVTFPEPMPENRRELDHFPASWEGTWTSHVQGIDAAGEDEILIVKRDRIRGLGDDEEVVLGQDAVLKRLGRKRILSFPQKDSDRYSVVVAQRRGDMLEVRAFDPEQDDAIENWESTIGADRMLQIHRKDDPEKRLKEVQLNPKNTRQFRALLREGTTELVTYARVKDREPNDAP